MKRCPSLLLLSLWCALSAVFLSCGKNRGAEAPDRRLAAFTAQGKSAADGPFTAWVMLKDQRLPTVSAATRGNWNALGHEVYGQLTARAATTQAPLLAWLAGRGIAHQGFWIVNAIRVTADQATLAEVAARPEVDRLVPEGAYAIPPVQRSAPAPRPTTVEWGLDNIRAPQAWSAFGVRGEGVVVANIDTGVQFDHPALVQKYRGNLGGGTFDHNYNWFDAQRLCGQPSRPCDTQGHGTHTMGTMVGDDGDPGANQIGVAPHARWIATNGCCDVDALLSSFQWVMAPTDLAGQNPSPDRRAHVVNNSWGGPSGDPLFQAAVRSWVAAGIFPAFASGNSGPSCGSAGAPGDYPESYSAGSHDIRNLIAPSSSRGPSAFGGILKPNLSAPGREVRSSVPGGGYDVYSGTSMAAPHLSGVVALMWSAAPSLLGQIDATRAILDGSAIDTGDTSCGGTPEHNNVFGQGRLDAFAALEASPRGPVGTLRGTVTSTEGGPLAGALVQVEGDSRREIRTDASGAYSVTLAIGTYRVSASSFGYLTGTAEGVTITEGATTVTDFALAPAPAFAVSGQVRDAAGSPHVGAKVTLLGTPLPPATTDAEGRYRFSSVPVGSYQARAEAGPCIEQQTSALPVEGEEVLDFTLNIRRDAFGHHCQQVQSQFIEAQTVLPLTGLGEVNVPLPFAFPFYGRSYEAVTVSASGFISFTSGAGNRPPFLNSPIPDPTPPNAAIYALWDAVVVDGAGSVRTQLVGAAPDRRFVIEWRDVSFLGSGLQARFEIVLHENGRVLLQYAPPADAPEQRGSGATVGLEDEGGTVAFQYSYNEAVLDPGKAILFQTPPSGFVEGTVTDANDARPIAGVEVRVLQPGAPEGTVVRRGTTSGNGRYRLQVPVGSYRIEAGATGYPSEQRPLTVTLDQTVTVDFTLATARAVVTPPTLQLVVEADQTRTRALTLENTGTLPLDFTVAEAGGNRQTVVSTVRLPRRPLSGPVAWDTRGLFEPEVPAAGGWAPTAPGNVIRSFVPIGMQTPWGVGYTGQLWLSDPIPRSNWEFTLEGTPTGRRWPTPWATEGAADMAPETRRGLICQLAPFVNGIFCWGPATGVVTDSISGSFPWTAAAQFGLAYREDDDSFYVGGWEQGTIYHVKGLGHPDRGAVIGQCQPADGRISGLAWNGAMRVLWATTNSPTDSIYELDPRDCTVLSVLPPPAAGGFQGAGLDMDRDGNLWTVAAGVNRVFLVESGVPAFNDVPWLNVAPAAGTVAPGGKTSLQVTVDSQGLAPGVYLATVFVSSNAGRDPRLRIPVSLLVTDYQQAVNAGGRAHDDHLGDPWAADQPHSEGSWGYVRRSDVRTTSHEIAGTTDPRLYQSQRIDPYAYRFDAVPNGIYQVELRFAELEAQRTGGRLFDVISEETLVLPAHDIAYRVGRFAADDHTFFVEVTDGRMDVRLVPRAGSAAPVINALRITHRLDR